MPTPQPANYLYFRAQMAAAGIEPGDGGRARRDDRPARLSMAKWTSPRPTSCQSRALGGVWVGETAPEVWRLLGIPPSRSPIGYVIVAGEPEFGGYRLRDARRPPFDTTPEIFDQTRISAVGEPSPNDTVVMGSDISPELARQILATLAEIRRLRCLHNVFMFGRLVRLGGLEPAEDSAYDPIRTIKDTLDWKLPTYGQNWTEMIDVAVIIVS